MRAAQDKAHQLTGHVVVGAVTRATGYFINTIRPHRTRANRLEFACFERSIDAHIYFAPLLAAAFLVVAFAALGFIDFAVA